MACLHTNSRMNGVHDELCIMSIGLVVVQGAHHEHHLGWLGVAVASQLLQGLLVSWLSLGWLWFRGPSLSMIWAGRVSLWPANCIMSWLGGSCCSQLVELGLVVGSGAAGWLWFRVRIMSIIWSGWVSLWPANCCRVCIRSWLGGSCCSQLVELGLVVVQGPRAGCGSGSAS